MKVTDNRIVGDGKVHHEHGKVYRNENGMWLCVMVFGYTLVDLTDGISVCVCSSLEELDRDFPDDVEVNAELIIS